MAICKDPRLTFLNDKGYNVVLLPREGINPLDILGRDGKSMERLGTLSQLWNSTVPAPAVKPPVPASIFAGTKTDDLKLSVGLALLSNALSGMGVKTPNIEAAYQQARKVQFTFINVVSVAVDALAVGNYLAAGDLPQGNPFIERYFEDEDTSAFVITEVLKSNAISVTAKDEKGTALALDVPVLQQAVGGKVEITTGGSAATDITYTGKSLLTFGFKAFGIMLAGGDWKVFGVKASKDMAFDVDMDEPELDQPFLLGRSRMINVA